MARVVVIDNYDSFTWNLVHLIGPLVDDIEVVRNDVLTSEDIINKKPDALVFSPGPGNPESAGICLDLIDKAKHTIPMFGVCLGLQAIGQIFGGSVIRAPVPVHGKLSDIVHRSQTIFRGINGPLKSTRYHSLIIDRDTCPAELAITAETRDGLIMALSHTSLPIHGVQFHPESILSEHGSTIMRNFLSLADEWKKTTPGLGQ